MRVSNCFFLGLILVVTRSAFSTHCLIRPFLHPACELAGTARRGGGPSWRDWRPATHEAALSLPRGAAGFA